MRIFNRADGRTDTFLPIHDSLEIPVPNELENRIRSRIASIEEPNSSFNMKKVRMNKKFLYSTTGCLLGLTCMFAVGCTSPEAAHVMEHIPAVGKIFELLGNDQLTKISEHGYVTKLNQSIEDQGVVLTIGDLYYDGSNLVIGYTVQLPANKDTGDHNTSRPLPGMSFTINGKPLLYGGTNDIKPIGNHLFAGAFVMDLTNNIKLPDHFTLHIDVARVGSVGGSGKWKYAIPVSKDKASAGIRVLQPNLTEMNGDTKIHVEKVVLTPFTTNVTVLVTGKQKNMNDYEFRLFDQYDTILSPGTSSAGPIDQKFHQPDDVCTYEFHINASPIDIHATELHMLTIFPWQNHTNYQTAQHEYKYDLSNQKLPFLLKNEFGADIQITKIEYEPTKTLVYYQVKDLLQSMGYVQIPYFYLQDEQGKKLASLDLRTPKRVANEYHTFLYEFPALDSKQHSTLISPVTTYTPPLSLPKTQNLTIPLN